MKRESKKNAITSCNAYFITMSENPIVITNFMLKIQVG